MTPEKPIQPDLSEHAQLKEEILGQFYFDDLTGLYRRQPLINALESALAHAERTATEVGVVDLDIDNFRSINDVYGNKVGDEVLREVARRLRSCLRKGDLIARWGSDEFMAMLSGMVTPAQIDVPIQKILDAMEAPVVFGDEQIRVNVSIGGAVCPEDAVGASLLLQCADVALHRARGQGGRRYVRYHPDLATELRQRVEFETRVLRALDNGEFHVYFQPQFDIATRELTGSEALLRWLPPGEEPISPAYFIPLAEETGMIAKIGEWVIDATIDQIGRWQAAGLSIRPVSINLSAEQMQTGSNVVETVDKALMRTGVSADMVWFELTESSIVRNPAGVKQTLDHLKSIGSRIALDDFGTGNSSLRVLLQFPIDTLKIDRSFVSGITRDARSAQVVRAVIGLAHDLDMQVVAEGVETEEELVFLRAYRCDIAQGFLFDKGVPAETFEQRWLRPTN